MAGSDRVVHRSAGQDIELAWRDSGHWRSSRCHGNRPTSRVDSFNESLRSRSKNTPLLGMTVRGRAVLTISGGEVRHNDVG